MNAGAGLPGTFVTFEGIEGCGKTTQLERLAARLADAGAPPVVTREPGGTELGRQLRRLLLARTATAIEPVTELLLYVADRAQHVGQVVLPALRDGRVVLCDRYLDATLAYQGHGRGLDAGWIERLHRLSPLDLRPRRTVLLDLEPRLAIERARSRNAERGTTESEGRFEAEALAFHTRVRNGYLALARAEPERFCVIDARGDATGVHDRVVDALRAVLPVLAETSRR